MGIFLEKKGWICFVEKIEKLVKVNPHRNKSETKSKIIEPLLRELGWSFLDDEVETEHSIDLGTNIEDIDYALLVGKRPAVFLEVKSLGSKLKIENQKKKWNYAAHEDVKWFALTNGTEIKIFNTEREGDPQENLIGEASLRNFKEKKHVFEIISRDSIMSEKTDGSLQNIRQRKRIIEKIKENRGDIRERIVEILKDYSEDPIYDELKMITDKFVDSLPEKINNYSEEEKEKNEVREPISKILRKNKLLDI